MLKQNECEHRKITTWSKNLKFSSDVKQKKPKLSLNLNIYI